MKILDEQANWRIVYGPLGAGYEMVFVQARAKDDGKWRFVDCGYTCLHCGSCLGCLRKLVQNDDDTLNAEIECEKSPTGYHEYNETA